MVTKDYRCVMTATSVPVPGGRLHAVDEGAPTAPPIVLLHAGIADSRSWDALAPLLAEAGYRVIRYDARGFGRSETDDIEFSNRADLRAVMDALGIGRAVLVGNSRGGQIAFDTAIESPGRVTAVVGVAAGLSGYAGDVTPEEEGAFEDMEALEAADEADAEAIADIDVRVWVDGIGQHHERVPSAIRELVREMDAQHNAPGRVHGKPLPLHPPANDRLHELVMPVLAVAGDLDVSDVLQTARHLEASAPNARAVILPGVAHMIGMEAPDRLAELVVDFIAPLPRWS